jgi:hypothetical protein
VVTEPDDELPIDQRTIFKFRVRRQFVEVVWLFIFLSGMAVAFGIFGMVQFWTCTLKNPDISFMECMRHENLNPHRGRK